MASQALKVKANVLPTVSKPCMIGLCVGGWQVLGEFIKSMNEQYLKGYCDYTIEVPPHSSPRWTLSLNTTSTVINPRHMTCLIYTGHVTSVY